MSGHRRTGAPSSILRRDYGRLADGRPVHEYTLDNGAGVSLSAINLGGIVTAIRVPDRDGVIGNVVLGFDSLAAYEAPHPHLGTIVGRCANRIARGRFVLEGRVGQLALNDGGNALHGGPVGFGRCWWQIEPLPPAGDGSVAIELHHVSPDGDQGYPGELQAQVRYTLTPRNEWRIDYHATCDRPTIVNLTHHDYFNLAGAGSVADHRLTIAASRYCPIDAELIPQGIAQVSGTPFDFRRATAIGARLHEADPQLAWGGGYDHNWVLDETDAPRLRFAARLVDPASGRMLEIDTTEPGLQFYSGNFLDGSLIGTTGQPLRRGDGLCLETQHFPDAPNHPEFPSTLLRPGAHHASTTVHRFGVCSDSFERTAT